MRLRFTVRLEQPIAIDPRRIEHGSDKQIGEQVATLLRACVSGPKSKRELLDLAGDDLHDVLIDHLRSHDFFDSAVYPEARFRAEKMTPLEGVAPGAPNLRVEGELTLKDRTLPVRFDAVAGFTPEGDPAAQATLAFDRTEWNVLYGSGRFFRNLGMHLVNDLIEVQLRIVGK